MGEGLRIGLGAEVTVGGVWRVGGEKGGRKKESSSGSRMEGE